MTTKSQNPDAIYNYQNEAGQTHYMIFRFPDKKFKAGHHDGKRFIWNMRDIRRVLYNLPELVKRKDETIYIVEGEPDVDRLHKEGLLATTNSHGPGQWRNEYSETLKDRNVVIIPDNDDEGRRHAKQVAKALAEKARSVKIVGLPNLPEHGDVSDWLDAGNKIDDLKSIVEVTELWATTDEEVLPESGKQNEKPSQTEQLIQMILSSEIELFKDQRGQPYAWIQLEKGKTCIPVKSQDFTDWIAGKAWKEMDWAIGTESLGTVKRTLAYTAKFDGFEYPLSVRVAEYEGSIWVNLDGFKAVRINADGWGIVDDPPILFRNFAHQRPLPIPERNGDLKLIHNYVNLSSDSDRLLFDAFIICGFIPKIQIPISLLCGPPHSGKSSMHKVIRRVLDPCHPEFQGKLRNMRDFAQIASQHRVLIYDNMSTLNPEQSDFLCGAVTGDGSEKRGLYTDEDTITFEYQNPICMNGVEMVASQSDLIDRSITQQLKQIPEDEQKNVSQLEGNFLSDLPRILGGIFDILSEVIRTADSIDLEWRTRFGDFTRYGAATAEALGKTRQDFITAYKYNVEKRYQDIIDGNPIAVALVEFMKEKAHWEGSATKLLQLLIEVARKCELETKASSWPKQPNQLSGKLSYLQECLHHAGMSLEKGRSNGNRVLIITRRTGKVTMEPTISDDQRESIVIPKPALQKRLDDGDGLDDGMTETLIGVSNENSS